MPFSNSHNTLKLRFPAEDEFPDLSGHNNHMAKVLTPELYAELRAKSTPSGFTVDDVIQTGVEAGVKACSACVSRLGAGEVSSIKSSSITGVHFSLDSGSSYFGASPGQLGSDQKPQAEETRVRRLRVMEGATCRPALCSARPEGSAARSSPLQGRQPPSSPARGNCGFVVEPEVR